ncbi:DUF551 domain-containing protein [Photorhabdus khanii]|uniref:DUF551 domain-containing protein n=1 Tax=Photorhabdus khanii subsp. guanajuatensis TaxID=2100166 RepID=A0A4R4IL87_9GAMM|nr:DUF551 domain-containing protein [Photorhabdus khanii]TDB41250.1 hypothetical protein C5467_24600 [Photorhabdus khanii subsp. guanajuatensis]
MKSESSAGKLFTKLITGVFMEWISVKDKLPKHREYVLAYTNCFDIVMFYYDILWFECCTYISIDSCTDDTIERNGVIVTHWMPLPNPPEVKLSHLFIKQED